jgi:hypothetical protein
MPFVRFDRQRSMLSIGTRVWMFTRVRHDDDYLNSDDYSGFRMFVFHAGRLHITIEWRIY